jgi:FRG domain
MATDSQLVRSLDGFIKCVAEVRDKWSAGTGGYADPWFRGQPDRRWDLLPSLYRRDYDHIRKDDILRTEEEFRDEFIRRGMQLAGERQPTDEWGWYFLQRHYGCPTRLLDWSDSALVALFFAINSNEPEDIAVTSVPCVWALDPWWLNRISLGHDSVIGVGPTWPQSARYLPRLYGRRRVARLPAAIDPPHIAARVAVQRSRFTVHGTERAGMEVVSRRKGARLLRIDIKKDAVDRVRLDLMTCGITEAVLFPDLGGLARDLRRDHHTLVF